MNGLSDNKGNGMFEMYLKDPNFLIDVFHNIRAGLMVIDIDGRIVYFNKAAEEITGFSAEEVKGQQCATLMTRHCMALNTGICAVSNKQVKMKCVLFRQGALYNRKCRMRARDGRAVYLLRNASVLRDHYGDIIGAVESMTDISSLYMNDIEIEGSKFDNYDRAITDLYCPEHCQTGLERDVPFDPDLSLPDVEKKMIEEALRKANGTMTAAAKLLSISYDTLRYRMRKFGIKSRKQRREEFVEKS